MRVKIQNPSLPLLALLALILQIKEPSRAWTILFIVFGGAVVGAYLWGRMVARNLALTRERRVGWLQVGGHVSEKITLHNNAVLAAAWVQLRDHSSLPDYTINTALPVNAGDFAQWDTRAECNHRGLFSFGDADLEIGDPFGIFRFIVHDCQRTSVMILPSIVALPPYPVTPSGLGGDGPRRANSPEVSHNAASVREYQPGDSPRLIHWPTTARQGQFFVRQFDSAPTGDWWILPDLNRATRVGEGLDSTEEAVVTLAASLVQRGLDERKRVGLLVNAAEPIRLAPQSGEAQRWALMQALAIADSSPHSLASFLEHARNFIHQRASLLIVTADASADWLPAIQPWISRGIAPTIFLVETAKSAQATADLLRQRGLASHLITREALRPFAQPGNEHWTWSSAGGQILPVRVRSNQASTREKA